MDVLTAIIDVAEARIQTDRIAVLVTGSDNGVLQWDLPNSSNVFVEGITNTAFLIPNALTPAFATSATGINARLRLADTNRAGSSNWLEHVPDGVANNYYLLGQNTNEALTTLATYEKNVGWYFSYFAFGQGDAFLQFEATWGTIKLQIYSDGEVVWSKAGLQFGSGSLTSFQPVKTGGEFESHFKAAKTGNQKGAVLNEAIRFIVLPFRQRELLFLCNKGGGFRAVLEDIDPSVTNSTILPAGTMTVQIPNGKPDLQFAPLQYATSGYLKSFTRTMRTPPVAAAVPTNSAYSGVSGNGFPVPTVTARLKDTDGSTNFVGDGTKQTCIMRVDLTGSGFNTPFVYGAKSVFDAVTANTDGAHQQVLDAWTEEIQLSVGDQASGVTCSLGLIKPAVVDASVAKSRIVGNRAIVAKIGTIAFLTGRTNVPQFRDGPVDAGNKLKWELRDWWKVYETYQILDPTPFDGMRLGDAVKEVARYPGFTAAQMDVEDFDFTIPEDKQTSDGEWAVIPEAGDTCAKWLEQFYNDYARFAIVGWYPSATGPKFRFKSEDAMGTTADATIYLTRAAAMSVGGFSEADHIYHVCNEFEDIPLEVETNDLWVTGWDSRIDRAFQSYWKDSASQAVATVPASRPDNWLGEPRRISLFKSAIRDQGTADWVNGVIRKRAGVSRRTVRIKTQMQFNADSSPLWRGNVLKVHTYGRFRVQTLSLGSIIETTNRTWREAEYVCYYLGA